MRHFKFLFLLCLFTLGTVSASAQTIAIDKVLVIVNNEAITLSEYRARHQREVLQQSMDIGPFSGQIDMRILNRMIDDRIQAQTATNRGIDISPQEVDRAIDYVASQNGVTAQQLLDQLAQDGIAPDQFRFSVKEQQLIRQLVDIAVNSRVVISDQEVENYLASYKELNTSEESFEVSHLFISVAGRSDIEIQAEYENLENIRQSLIEGRSFAKSVEEFSDGPNKEEGGYLGWRKVNQLPDLFLQALRKTDMGGVTEIIQSSNGLHLLKLHDRKGGGEIVEQQLVRQILIRPNAELTDDDARELAGNLYFQITAGEDFEKLARIHSADRATRTEGGLMGWVNPGQVPPEFEQAMRDLQLNEVSKPVRTRAGYHLIQVLDRRQNDISLDIAGNRARQLIFQRKAAEFYDNWYGSLRDAAFIEYVAVDPG